MDNSCENWTDLIMMNIVAPPKSKAFHSSSVFDVAVLKNRAMCTVESAYKTIIVETCHRSHLCCLLQRRYKDIMKRMVYVPKREEEGSDIAWETRN